MEQITLRLPTDTLDELDAEADERGIHRREHIWDMLETRNEHAGDVDELRERIDELETELERVRNEKRLILQERDIEQRWREADLWTRLKWRLLGMPGDGDDEET